MSGTASADEIRHLVQTIDDNADILHADLTPSVQQLTRLGLPAAQAVLPLLNDPKQLTRMRAFVVLGNIVMQHHGWQAGRGYARPDQEDAVTALMHANGDYSVTAPPE